METQLDSPREINRHRGRVIQTAHNDYKTLSRSSLSVHI